jgi:hypothetical protein
VIIIGVILALVFALNTRPSLKAMLKYEGCELFDPNDASLQVRLDNQKILKNLSSRPWRGIGHGGKSTKNIYLMLSFQT